MSRVALTAIYSQCNDRIMGIDGDLPIRLKEDMKMFSATTQGNHCVMGRKTWESLPETMKKNKKGRTFYVLTKNHLYRPSHGAIPIHDFDTFLTMIYSETETVYLIGGAEILNRYLSYCDTLFVTEIDYDALSGLSDVTSGEISRAPVLYNNEFRLSREIHPLYQVVDGKKVFFQFKEYVRVS